MKVPTESHINNFAIDPRSLFLKTLEDLEKKIQSEDWYDMLLISGLIYKLLYDKHPLINAVNSSERQVIFNVNNKSMPVDPTLNFYSIEDGIDPDTSPFHLINIVKMNKEKLYCQPIMVVRGEIVTIKDLICFLRNKQGSVHMDNISLNDKEKLLKELQETLLIGGVNAGLRLTRAIGRVIVKGLNPLRESKE